MTWTVVVVAVVVAISAKADATLPDASATSTTSASPAVIAVLASLRQMLDYFRNNYQQQQVIDVDVAIGLRVIEGQSKLLVEEYERGELEFIDSRGPMKSVSALGVEAGRLANMVIPHVHESDRKRFVQLRSLVEGPFKFFHPHRVVNPSLRWADSDNFRTVASFRRQDEEAANECFGELMVTTTQPNKGNVKTSKPAFKCSPTANCLTSMLTPGERGHRLQRQIFYTILVQRNNCERQVNEFLVSRSKFRNVEQVQHEFCTNAYYELEEASASGIRSDFRDLFMEMEFFCPSVGYFQFMKLEWLAQILSWQSETGCFPKPSSGSISSKAGFPHAAVNTASIPSARDSNLGAEISMQLDQGLSSQRRNGDFNYGHVDEPYIPPQGDDVRLQFIPTHFQQQQPWRSPAAAPVADIRRWPAVDGHFANNGGPNQLSQPRLFRPNEPSGVSVGIPASSGVLNRMRGLKTVDDQVDGQRPFVREMLKLPIGSCLSRFTSMASSALSLYLRYLLDPGPPEFLHLRLENYLRASNNVLGQKYVKNDNWTASNYKLIMQDPPAEPGQQQRGPALARPSLPIAGTSIITRDQHDHDHVDVLKINVGDMVSKAYNFMGTYQRRWGPRYQSVDVIDPVAPAAGVSRLPDYVHRADVLKELPDWTVSLAKLVTRPVQPMNAAVRLMTTKTSDKETRENKMTATRTQGHELDGHQDKRPDSLKVQIIEIHPFLQRDLDNYLVIIALLSAVCLFAFMRYFGRCRRGVTAASSLKARYL